MGGVKVMSWTWALGIAVICAVYCFGVAVTNDNYADYMLQNVVSQLLEDQTFLSKHGLVKKKPGFMKKIPGMLMSAARTGKRTAYRLLVDHPLLSAAALTLGGALLGASDAIEQSSHVWKGFPEDTLSWDAGDDKCVMRINFRHAHDKKLIGTPVVHFGKYPVRIEGNAVDRVIEVSYYEEVDTFKSLTYRLAGGQKQTKELRHFTIPVSPKCLLPYKPYKDEVHYVVEWKQRGKDVGIASELNGIKIVVPRDQGKICIPVTVDKIVVGSFFDETSKTELAWIWGQNCVGQKICASNEPPKPAATLNGLIYANILSDVSSTIPRECMFTQSSHGSANVDAISQGRFLVTILLEKRPKEEFGLFSLHQKDISS